MLKILIVDDEVNVRIGLRESFNWEQMGFIIIGDAADGEDALRLYKEHIPDIVITDICMSNIGGLELIARLKAMNPDVEIIILSGYSDFNYAKTALENEVFTYLLKPIKISDMIDIMNKLKKKIYDRRQILQSVAEFSKSQRGRFLNELLLKAPTAVETINKLCQKYQVSLPNSNFFVAAAQIDNANDESIYNSYEVLCEKFYQHFMPKYNLFLYQTSSPNIIVLVFCSERHVENTVFPILAEVKQSFSQSSGHLLTIGVSNLFSNIASIGTAHMQALFAAQQRAFLGYNRIIHYNRAIVDSEKDGIATSLYINGDEVNSILSGLKTLNSTIISKTLDRYFDRLYRIKNADVTILKNTIWELALLIIRTAAENTDAMNIIFGRIPQPVAEIQALELIPDMRAYLESLIQCIFKHQEIQTARKYSKPVQEAITYIMKNYHLPITIESAIRELHISRTTLLRLFKKDTGKTFNDYLSEYRIRVSEELIRSGNYKMYEISSRVGYQDAKYFSKLFKSITGYSPSDYPKSKEHVYDAEAL